MRGLAGAMLFAVCALSCQQVAAQSKDAEPATRAANESFARSLPFADRADFDDAQRGFIATLPDGVTLTRPAFDAITLKERTFVGSVVTGDVVISGNPLKLAELFSLFDEFPSNFEVVEPRKATIE
jgi:alkyl sulfatase BDS1-like metallo-beta-lactamase superfamily hydrolase